MMRKFEKILSDYENDHIVDPYLAERKYYYRDAAMISALHKNHYGLISNIIIGIGLIMFLSLLHSLLVFICIYLFFIVPMVVISGSIDKKSVKYDDISYDIWLKEMKYFSYTSKVV